MHEVSARLSRTPACAKTIRGAALAASFATLAFACEETPGHEPFSPQHSDSADSRAPATRTNALDAGSSQGAGATPPPVASPAASSPSTGTLPSLLDAGPAAQIGLAIIPMIGAVNLVDASVALQGDAGGSGISPECDAQIAKCNSVGPDLIADCVAVARHCNPVANEVSPECKAQTDEDRR